MMFPDSDHLHVNTFVITVEYIFSSAVLNKHMSYIHHGWQNLGPHEICPLMCLRICYDN